MRHTMKLAVMVVAVAVAVMSGLAIAQTDDTPGAEDPVQNHQTRVGEQLAPLVENGTITQAQADAIAEHFADRFAERRAQREEYREQRQAFHEELLGLLDMTAAELRTAASEGMTLAQVAEQQGVPVDDVIALLVSQAEERIADAVADGRLTQEEADEKLADVTGNITDKVNNGPGFGRGHRHGPDGEGTGGLGFGGRGRGGFGGPGFGGPGFGVPEAPAADAVNA
jgi:polyhydroxyalkanoate synthesis regulator phasin